MGKTETSTRATAHIEGERSCYANSLLHWLPQLPSARSRWLPPPLPRAAADGAAACGGFHHHHWGHGFGIGYIGVGVDDGCYVTKLVPTPFGYRMRTVNICGY